MTEEDKARIQELVQELDDLVPRTDAVVLMNQYGGGCDESQITATETGYLRMGIELLKAVVAPPLAEVSGVQIGVDWEYLVSEKSGVTFHMFHLDNTLKPVGVDWEYLVSEKSGVTFHMFHLDNTLKPDTPYSPKSRLVWKDWLSLTGGILLTVFLVWVFGVGLVTTLRWVFR